MDAHINKTKEKNTLSLKIISLSKTREATTTTTITTTATVHYYTTTTTTTMLGCPFYEIEKRSYVKCFTAVCYLFHH